MPSFITTVLCFNPAAAQRYTAFHSFLLSRTRERTEYKIKLMSRDKNYLPRQKRKREITLMIIILHIYIIITIVDIYTYISSDTQAIADL